ncbi:esterase-like activity of phytase family protein [Sulfurimonas sp.]
MYNLLIIFFLFPFVLFAKMDAYNIKPLYLKTNQYQKIIILDSKVLHFDRMDSLKVTELSGLAYKNHILYALSDKGNLFQFDLLIQNSKIVELKLLKAYKLRKKHSKLKSHDSEGLAFMGDNLLISFEQKHRVSLYSTNGIKISKMKINKQLRDLSKYKGKNKGLEGVAYNKKYGIVTAPEKPLKTFHDKFHRLYTKDKIYKFKAKGYITGLEFIDKDNILVLLRKFNLYKMREYIALVAVDLSQCNKKQICKTKDLAAFDSKNGWNIDNFEGVTKVGKNEFLMISDDNNFIFQKTLLVLFKIMN